jgi:transcription elongation GreA/GreB family factor
VLDKARLLASLREHVAADLAALERRQRDAQAGSTHAESRAEHAKDTRATEQSYLARGLAERVEDLARTAAALDAMALRSFEADDAIAITALVLLRVEDDDDAARRETWWIVGGAGGIDVEQDGVVVRTVTPVAPLGRALLGLQVGDEGEVRTPRGTKRFEVIEVQ